LERKKDKRYGEEKTIEERLDEKFVVYEGERDMERVMHKGGLLVILLRLLTVFVVICVFV